MEEVADIRNDKYLLFLLEHEYYGISILKVNEIIGLSEITPIPKTPPYMKGIINLRGRIIPVIDLRTKFGMSEKAYDAQTCDVIVERPYNGKMSYVGLLVDKVAEVVSVLPEDIDKPFQYGQTTEDNFITGIGKVKDMVVMLLDIDKVLSTQDMIHLSKDSQEVKV